MISTIGEHPPRDPLGYYRCLRTATLLHGHEPAPPGCILLNEPLFLQCCHALGLTHAHNAKAIGAADKLQRN